MTPQLSSSSFRALPGKRRRTRPRAAQACQHCRLRKVRCDTSLPCSHCKKQNIKCIFDKPLPNYPRGTHEEIQCLVEHNQRLTQKTEQFSQEIQRLRKLLQDNGVLDDETTAIPDPLAPIPTEPLSLRALDSAPTLQPEETLHQTTNVGTSFSESTLGPQISSSSAASTVSPAVELSADVSVAPALHSPSLVGDTTQGGMDQLVDVGPADCNLSWNWGVGSETGWECCVVNYDTGGPPTERLKDQWSNLFGEFMPAFSTSI